VGYLEILSKNLNWYIDFFWECISQRKMLCISRYTDDAYAQQFGDGRHKFYLEFRCNRPCLKGMDCCAKCAEKSATSMLQTSRKFNHGKVSEPVPDSSHIFGGKWYCEGARKWGVPPSEIIEFAYQCQKEAREGFIVEQPLYEEENKRSKDAKTTSKSKSVSESTETPVKNRTRKPKILNDNETDETTATTATTTNKKTRNTKKTNSNPYTTLVNNKTTLVHKETTIPSHIETQSEMFDAEGFRIEYIKLTLFEANGTTYLIDSKKNKLYKKIKDKDIGPYIGRWNSNTDSIITDIPDSDDEYDTITSE